MYERINNNKVYKAILIINYVLVGTYVHTWNYMDVDIATKLTPAYVYLIHIIMILGYVTVT